MRISPRKWILISCLLAVFLAGRKAQLHLTEELERQAPAGSLARPAGGSEGRAPASEVAAAGPDRAPTGQVPLSEEELEAARALVQLQAKAVKLHATSELLAALGEAKLAPVLSRDTNHATGTMELVRTSNALPGTRYLHAQFFGHGEGQPSVLQHFSFEIRPSPDAMERALAWIREAYGNLGIPEIQTADYVLWRTPQHRVISAKRLSAEDLRHNYFNAHAPEDVGTVWVVNELDPEAEG